MKMAFFVRRAEGVTHQQLIDHWLQRHALGVRDHMEADHYSVTEFKQRDDTPFDGFAELWYDDPAKGPAMFSAQPQAVADDGFVPLTGDFVRLDSTEHVIVDGPRVEGGLKMVYPVSLREGVEPSEALGYWLEVHAPLVAASVAMTDGAHRYVVTQQIEAARGRYAGFAELWYDSTDALAAQGRVLERDEFDDFTVTHQPLMGTEHIFIP